MPFRAPAALGLASFALCLALSAAPSVSAHELLPKALVEYMEEHPDATAAELQAFMEGNPELSDKSTEDKLRIIEATKNQETGLLDTAWDFIALGVHHILAGLDHILFVLSLLLTYVSLRHTLRLVTAFTVAHSITLILAGAGIVVLSPAVVEPVIALSIAYVALTSVFLRKYPFFGDAGSKVLAVFFFGLFHGLGFAGLLTELSIPGGYFLPALLFFNAGIELGQLMILAPAVPAVLLLRRSRWKDLAVKTFAVAIAALALWWTYERVAGALA